MSYVLKVSLPNIDVKTATPEQCAVHSGFNAPKVDATKEHFVTVNILFNNEPPNAALGSTLETILYKEPHDYNYVPQLWTSVEFPGLFGGNREFGPGEALVASGGAANNAFIGTRADENFYYVYIRKAYGSNISPAATVTGKSVSVRIYIMADSLFE